MQGHIEQDRDRKAKKEGKHGQKTHNIRGSMLKTNISKSNS